MKADVDGKGSYFMNKKSNQFTRDFCLGTQMPYMYAPEIEVPLPKGYQPFYINYIGRHGGRYLSNRKEAEWISTILGCAYEHQGLTIRGLELYSKIVNILELMENQPVNMNPNGMKAVESIAHRMCLNYPSVFGRNIHATSTREERTCQSRDVFLHQIERTMGKQKCMIHTNGSNDPILRFYDCNPKYIEYRRRGQWIKSLEEFEKRSRVENRITDRIFHSAFYQSGCLSEDEKNRFVTKLYQLYTNQIDTSGVISLGYYFTTQERYYFWENINAKQYMLMGPGLVGQGVNGKIAFPLLEDFLNTVNDAIQKRDTSLDLIMTHAETLLPFITLLQIPGMSEQVDSLSKVVIAWKNYQIAPMAANLQWIFYEKKDQPGKDILVQCKLNEQRIHLPIPTKRYPYYEWNDVYQYYKNCLDSLSLPKGKNYSEMLKFYRW